MTTTQRRRRTGLFVGTAIGAGLLLWSAGGMELGLLSVTHAQTAARTPEQVAEAAAASLKTSESAPVFELDRSWPKQPLPNNWGLGIVWAVDVDANDHIWVLHQTNSPQYQEQIKKAGKVPAPALIEFDQQGNVVQAWGAPGQGGWKKGEGRAFPAQAMKIDWKGNIWVSEESRGHAVVKFTRDGKFLMQIGEVDKTGGSEDTKLLGGPSGIDFDPSANEVYIADGYHVNQRVVVFDADTGAYKRHWGRFGLKPDDTFEAGEQPTWIPSPFLVGKKPNLGRVPRYAHGVNVSRDGLVYVADRSHSTIYVHKKDGTYVKEARLPGPANSVAFSRDPEQYYAYATGMNASARMYILRRSDLQVLGSFKSDGQHYMGVDSKNNLFTCGLFMPQRWVLKEMPKRPARSAAR